MFMHTEIQIVFSILVSGYFSGRSLAACYMSDKLDDEVLEEDERLSDEKAGKHDGERRVTFSQVNTFIVYVLVENRMSVCGTRVV
jgi:hypothetical protein